MRFCRVLGIFTAIWTSAIAAHDAAFAQPIEVRDVGSSVAGYVTEAARRFAIPEAWIYAVIRIESAGDPRAVSPKGATGLMQLMPATWEAMRSRYALGNDIYDAHDNIIAGAGYLREMYDRYGAPGFLAAYNAGPGRYEDYLANRRGLPAETVAYVRKLAPVIATEATVRAPAFAPDPLAWTRSAVFVVRSRRSPVGAENVAEGANSASLPAAEDRRSTSSDGKPNGLFIPLSGKSP